MLEGSFLMGKKRRKNIQTDNIIRMADDIRLLSCQMYGSLKWCFVSQPWVRPLVRGNPNGYLQIKYTEAGKTGDFVKDTFGMP